MSSSSSDDSDSSEESWSSPNYEPTHFFQYENLKEKLAYTYQEILPGQNFFGVRKTDKGVISFTQEAEDDEDQGQQSSSNPLVNDNKKYRFEIDVNKLNKSKIEGPNKNIFYCYSEKTKQAVKFDMSRPENFGKEGVPGTGINISSSAKPKTVNLSQSKQLLSVKLLSTNEGSEGEGSEAGSLREILITSERGITLDPIFKLPILKFIGTFNFEDHLFLVLNRPTMSLQYFMERFGNNPSVAARWPQKALENVFYSLITQMKVLYKNYNLVHFGLDLDKIYFTDFGGRRKLGLRVVDFSGAELDRKILSDGSSISIRKLGMVLYKIMVNSTSEASYQNLDEQKQSELEKIYSPELINILKNMQTTESWRTLDVDFLKNSCLDSSLELFYKNMMKI